MAKPKSSKTTYRAKGTGSVFRDAKGVWNAQVDLGRNVEGKRMFKRIRRKTQGELIKALSEFQAKQSLGVPTDTSAQTVGDFLDFWLQETIKPHSEPKTYRVYTQITRLYLKPKLGHLKLAKLGSQHVQAALNQLSESGGRPSEDGVKKGLSAKTVRDTKGVLCSALTTARNAELVRSNVAESVKTPKLPQRQAIYLTFAEAAALIEKSRDHYLGPLIEIALVTGLRLGEATGLTWDHVDFDLGVIRIRQQLQRVDGVDVLKSLKTRASIRTLALTDEGIATLREQQDRQKLIAATRTSNSKFNEMNLVFTSVKGRPLEGGHVDDVLKELCVLAKVKRVSFHKLRHTFATLMTATGVPMSVVKDLLGHSTLSMTSDTYAHAVPSAMKHASNMLDGMLRSGPQTTGS